LERCHLKYVNGDTSHTMARSMEWLMRILASSNSKDSRATEAVCQGANEMCRIGMLRWGYSPVGAEGNKGATAH
jgi:hypothetical protein